MILPLLATAVCAVVTAVDGRLNEEEYLEQLKIYSSLDHLLSFFKNEPNPLAQQILETFTSNCSFPDSKVQRDSLIKPVIVIEGNHKSSRDVVVLGLAELMHARLVTHPAPCLYKYHRLLPRGSMLRRAYYLLSNYAGSNYAKSQLNRPIIINGYWTEQLTFTLTHFYPPGCLPPVTSDIYQCPDDLLQPNLIFYLDFPDNLVYSHVTTKSPLIWKPRMMEAYRHLQPRHPVVIKEVKQFFKLTTEEIHRYIHEHLYSHVFGLRNSSGH